MYNWAQRIVCNQLAGISFLRRIKDSLAPTLAQYQCTDYNFGVCRHHISAVRQFGSYAPVGQNIVEIGPGGNLGNAIVLIASGARRVYCIDNYRHLDFQSSRTDFYLQLVEKLIADPEILPVAISEEWDTEKALKAIEDAVYFSGGAVQLNTDRIQYMAPCDALCIPLEDRSVDMIFSHAVLEHVKHPARVCREFGRVLKPGGYISHVIDLRDHFDPDGLQMLRYPTWLWNLMSSNSHGYVNRCRASHFEQFFRESGFKVLQSEATKILKDIHRIPEFLCDEFAELSVEQLQILDLSIVGIRNG